MADFVNGGASGGDIVNNNKDLIGSVSFMFLDSKSLLQIREPLGPTLERNLGGGVFDFLEKIVF